MSEIAWVFGVLLISVGVFLVTKAGFGVSMVVAPAYIIHLAVEHFLPWYTFGKSEYILQGVLLAAMCLIIRKFNWRYLLSFLTAVIYGELTSEGNINSRDLKLMMKFITGEEVPDKAQTKAADINRDGNISVKDLLLLSKMY